MSLRTRLFLLVGGLAAVLVVAQWWLVRSLSRDVSSEVGDVAFRVGEGVVTSLGMVERSPRPGSGPAPAPDPHALARRFEMPLPAPARPDARSVVEREIVIREIDGRLQVVSQHVKVGATDGTIVSTEDITPGSAPAADRFVTLSVDTAHDAGFLKVHSPSMERRVPIPRGGLDDALDAFRKRLLAGSAALLLGGIVVAAAIAHRATAPLRELRDAARAVGDGALGTQVPRGAGAGEVGAAVAAFNRMSLRLAELDADARRLREREHLTEVGEIARGLAHGLRNPLNALGLTVDELAQGPPESARAPLADAARRQIRRIDQSVRSFLALAASATRAPNEDVDVAALVQDVALEALQDARGRVGIGVQAPDETLRVRGVPAELRAVVQALVVNAVEASPDGARVRVSVEPGSAASVRIVIDDDGAGIADGVRARLFTPHVTTKSSGSGMGLYLAHRIVVARGGSLELGPRDPRGTRAVVELPA